MSEAPDDFEGQELRIEAARLADETAKILRFIKPEV